MDNHQHQIKMELNADGDQKYTNDCQTAAKKPSNMSFVNFKNCCITLMILLSSVVLISLILGAVKLLNNEQCTDQSLSHPNYKLHSTKTSYDNAKNFKLRLQNFSDYTLPKLDEHLRAKYQCEPVQLHIFARHAARYPNKENIKEYEKSIKEIQAKIDLDRIVNSSTNACYEPLKVLKGWSAFYKETQANLVTTSGLHEANELAQFFKKLYPKLFNASLSPVQFKVTGELRTAQTAAEFMKHVDNFRFGDCKFDELPRDPENHPEMITSDECYRSILRLQDKHLSVHKECDDAAAIFVNVTLGIKTESNYKEIINSVSKKLNIKSKISFKDLQNIYHVCSYETAMRGNSIWCSLFEDNDLKFFEHAQDAQDFYDAGGPRNKDIPDSTCDLTNEYFRTFKLNSFYSNFFFTHSDVIERIVARLLRTQDDPTFREKSFSEAFSNRRILESNRWRTSLLSPFSANIAFTVYQCADSRKVVTSINQVPVQFGACGGDLACDIQSFSSKVYVEECDVAKLCASRFVITA